MAWGEYLYMGLGFTASEAVITANKLKHSVTNMETKRMVAVDKGSKYSSHYKNKA